MAGPGTGSPDKSFQDRLNRMADRRAPIDAARPQIDVLPDWKQNFRNPAILTFAIVIGGLSVFLARLGRFHLFGGTLTGDAPGTTMLIDAAVAVAVSFVILTVAARVMARRNEPDGTPTIGDELSGWRAKAGQLVGAFGMIAIMHNFVHAAPGVFKLLFSDEWTNEIVANSASGTLYFSGAYLVVIPPEEAVAEEQPVEEEKKLPTIRRM